MRGLFKFSRREVSYLFEKNSGLVSRFPEFVCVSKPLNLSLSKDLEDLGRGRVLIIASRKIGCAVARNRLKRQLRHIFFVDKLFEKAILTVIFLSIRASGSDFSTLRKNLISHYNSLSETRMC